jgi:hypothetical protein
MADDLHRRIHEPSPDDDGDDAKVPLNASDSIYANADSGNPEEDEDLPVEDVGRAKKWAVRVAGPNLRAIFLSSQSLTALATVAIAFDRPPNS